jgi:uncharacterized protein (TIGR00251 family)
MSAAPARPDELQAAVDAWPCLSRHGAALWLAVSVSPNARRTAADGLHDGTLRIRLGAPPVDGKANEMLLAWVAGQLGLPRRAVTLVRGDTARRKWLAIDAPPQALPDWFARLGLEVPRAANN